MPCEACNVQFTVFRRKRCCFDCKRFYCSSCLNTPSLRSAVGPLCERCSIFAKRPLLKVDLLQLKPKDLIFYLQSKHISTAGCVEKDELVGLVLNHIQQTDQSHAESAGQDTRSFDTAHSFDSLKQSCQNFFSNISEKVDAFSFEAKPSQKEPQVQQNRRPTSTNQQSVHISEQPRVSTREIPTYASCKNRLADDNVTQISLVTPSASNSSQSNNIDYSADSSTPRTHSQTSSLESKSSSSSASSQQAATTEIQSVEQDSLLTTPDRPRIQSGYDVTINGFASGCECSDDEIITTFRARTCERLQSPQSTSSIENPLAGPSGSSNSNVLTSTSTTTKKSSPSLKIESYDESSESSFEELGAIGGILNDRKIGADNNGQSSELWQFVEKDALDVSDIAKDDGQTKAANTVEAPLTVAVIQQDANVQLQRPAVLATRPKKVTRRRSESYLNRTRHRSVDESPTSPEAYKPLIASNFVDAHCLREEDEPANERVEAHEDGAREEVASTHFHCKRCGKHGINIKNHVEKMRRHLENSQMTESDIKRELEEFLLYLEKRTKSFDCSDSEMTAASSVSGIRDANYQNPPVLGSMSPLQFFDDNEGIHVYAPPASYGAEMADSRFINLEDFESLEELERLCVKQLKEVLMLNRVDYKGCCEKQELLDRVVRLWKNLKSTPTIDKLQTDELCKICMDAPIECVILECGHMATCTSCGKVLSECPICRQYIVRVVRFFKA